MKSFEPEHRGKTVGVVQSGWAIGWGLAAILYTVAFSVLPEALAWRSMFWVGLVPALLVFYIRKHVQEPESFNKAQQMMRSAGKRPSFLRIFAPGILRTTLCSSLMCAGLQGGYYAIATWIPTFLRIERHLSVIGTGGYLAVLITGSFIGYASGGYISDRIGRRGNMLLFALLSAVEHDRLYEDQLQQRANALPWISAWILRIGNFRRSRRASDGTVSGCVSR